MRKKVVYVREYVRSRHGRAEFGGKVSDHLRSFKPMLAKARPPPPHKSPNRIWERKYDGTRALLESTPSGVRVVNRRGREITSRYPELQGVKHNIRGEAVLDGEIVVEKNGSDSFKLLSQRDRLQDKSKITVKSKEQPVKYIAFDMVEGQYHPLLDTPLKNRKIELDATVSDSKLINKIKYTKDPSNLWERAKRGEIEGVVGKKLDSVYSPGKRNNDWIKIKPNKMVDAVALGYTAPEGKRKGTLGSLVMGAYDNGKLKYIGKVGTGFSDKDLVQLSKELKKHKTNSPPKFEGPTYFGPRKIQWVKPQTVHRLKFMEWTPDKHMRMPVWEGERTDITPKEANL